ncbi:4Fe-4S binding protein [Thermotoga sp. Mc24]|uniref:4Fe-4S binding protein n=1 Tax=Thermotoga sp. Mc24 TaxID=1231241 RepID=UPI002E0F55F0
MCEKVCRFDAIIQGEKYRVDQYACEGCNACVVSCPRNVITLVQFLWKVFLHLVWGQIHCLRSAEPW